jgi:SAM-dependent methyltransferase
VTGQEPFGVTEVSLKLKSTSATRFSLLVVSLIVVGLAIAGSALWRIWSSNWEVSKNLSQPAGWTGINAPFITSTSTAIEKMSEIAELTMEDVVYDLGCGDGRIVIGAVQHSGCRGIGFDIDPERIKESIANATASGVSERLEFREQDVFTVDLSQCNVAMMYLLPWMVAKLEPQFEQMKPGSRIVSQDYYIEQVRPQRAVRVNAPTENNPDAFYMLYMYTTPLRRDLSMERTKPPQPSDAIDPTQ